MDEYEFVKKFDECDSAIDPLREAVFEAVIADEYASKGDWKNARDKLERALDRLRKFTPATYRALDRGILKEDEIEKLKEEITKLRSIADKRDEDEWMEEAEEKIIPYIVEIVYRNFAKCMVR